ncbi:MAG: BTAD domain-containing putative transcriptional regulator, partial [Saprospiraceae bacterium]
ATIRVQTLGIFQLYRKGEIVSDKEWGRDTALQLFQFLITIHNRRGLHKEQIIDRIWGDLDQKSGERNFKVALHAINKVLEPERESRAEPKFILRQGLTYQLADDDLWIDVEAFEELIKMGNQRLNDEPEFSIEAYRVALALYEGGYIPNRFYEDWSSDRREHVQVLVIGTLVTLAELLLKDNPLESVRLTQQAIAIDATWEDAYRIQMQAYFNKGNRPQAIRTFQQCKKVLLEEFDIEPLPETEEVFKKITGR